MDAHYLSKKRDGVNDALKLGQRAANQVQIAGGFPLALKPDLVRVLVAFVILILDCDGTAGRENKPVGNAGTHTHPFKVHGGANTALAFVRDVENQQPAPKTRFVEPLLLMLLQASFVSFGGFSGLLSGLFSG